VEQEYCILRESVPFKFGPMMDVYHWTLNKPRARRVLKRFCVPEPRPVTGSGNILTKRMMWRRIKCEVGGDGRLALPHLLDFRPREQPTPRGWKWGECQWELHQILLCPPPTAPAPADVAWVVQNWVTNTPMSVYALLYARCAPLYALLYGNHTQM
jgi:hypothetical protein